MNRAFCEQKPEWMDMPGADPAVLQRDLQNLGWINQTFGGTRAYIRTFKKNAELLSQDSRPFTLIDLATGYGDHPRALASKQLKQPSSVFIIAVDRQRTTLEIARNATPTHLPIVYVQADIRRLPFKNASADAVMCSLALHHFGEQEATHILRESFRVGRHFAACLDLARSRLAYLAVWLLTQFWLREPMTRHDARLSVKRAFTCSELNGLAHKAGWKKIRRERLPWFRQSVSVMKTSMPSARSAPIE